MKKINLYRLVTAMIISVLSNGAFAAVIQSGSFNPTDKTVELSVGYSGCRKHTFALEVGMCLESMPVRCGVNLVDEMGEEDCLAYFEHNVTIPLPSEFFEDDYFEKATISIHGGNNSSFRFILP